MPQQQHQQDDRDDLAEAWAAVVVEVAGRISERDRRDEPNERETEPVHRAA